MSLDTASGGTNAIQWANRSDSDDELRSRARQGDAEAIRELRRRGVLSGGSSERTGAGRVYGVSAAQRRIWMVQQMNPASSVYVMGGTLRLRGAVDHENFALALGDVRRANGILRSVYMEAEGRLVQREMPDESLPPAVTFTDVAAEAEPLEAAKRHIAAGEKPIDLATGPVFTANLYRLAAEEHLLHVRLHHIAGDGWSVRLLMEACRRAYVRRLAGEPAGIAPARQYRDYAAWQKARLAGEAGAAWQAYWKEKLADAPQAVDFPLDHARPALLDSTGGEVAIAFPPAISSRLAGRAAEFGTTPFVLLTAALKAAIHRLTGAEDVVVGTVAAGREAPQTQEMIGCFVNTLPLRDGVRGEMPFAELVRSVAGTLADALARQEYPYERMVADVFGAGGGGAHASQPMLGVVAIWEEDEAAAFEVLPGVAGHWLPQREAQVKFDRTCLFRRLEGGGVEMRVLYAAALWDERTIRDFAGRLTILLEAALAEPARTVGQLPLMTPAEREELSGGQAGRTAPAPPEAERNGIALFEKAARKTPDAPALVCGGARLSYRELNEAANRLARRLASAYGVGRMKRVGVLLPRSAEYVIAALAILKAGGVYVPLDPANPPGRLAELMALHDFACVVTRDEIFAGKDWRSVTNQEDLAAALRAPRADAGRLQAESAGEPAENPSQPISPKDWMYIIHTSGSTGKPEPVAVPHGAAANLLGWVGRELYGHFKQPMREAVSAALVFDVSIQQIFGSLSHGHCCHLIPDDTRSDLAALDSYIHDNRIDLVNFTPSLMEALLAVRREAWPVQVALVGAEAFPKRVLDRFWSLPEQRGTIVYNMYGPTECCVDATAERLEWPEAAERRPCLGEPVDNMRVYVLDAGLEPVPPGVAGELCVSGPGLADGYVGNAEKTATRFVSHPWRAGERLYRTGDRVRMRPDGRLEFLGRLDAQMKIRGYRIEPGEIEARLAAMRGVTSTAVIAARTPAGAEELVAFVVAGEDFDRGAARRSLGGELPEYMVPARVLRLARLPVTATGKLDRRELEALASARETEEEEFRPPMPGAEEALAGLWREILGVERIGRTDSFFRLGGSSLGAMRLSAMARGRLGRTLPLAEIFARPELADMAGALRDEDTAGKTAGKKETEAEAPPAAEPPQAINETAPPAVSETQTHPLSVAQQGLWALYRMDPDSTAYSMPEARRLAGRLDAAAFLDAARRAVAAHSALRTVFSETDGGTRQRIRPAEEWQPAYRDLSGEADPAAAAEEFAVADRERGFDLERDFPFRLTLARLAPEEHLLLVNAHHIAFDGGSLAPFVRDLEVFYKGETPPVRPQYAAFANWQRENLASDAWEAQRRHWLNHLTPQAEALDWPADNPRPPVRRFRGARTGVRLAPAVWRNVMAAADAAGANAFAACAALARLLVWRHTGQADVLLGLPVSGRSRPEWGDMVGYCVGNLALRIPVERTDNFRTLLEAARREAIRALSNADYPLELITDELPRRAAPGRAPLFDAIVVFEDEAGAGSAFAGIASESAPFAASTSRFDLAFIFRPDAEGGMGLQIEYDSDLFSPERMARAAGHVAVLAEAAAADPDLPLGELAMLAPEEAAAVTRTFAVGAIQARTATGIFGAVADAAEANPEATALWRPEGEKTYARVIAEAGRVARRLREAGAKKGSRVAVRFERGAEAPVAVLAVMAAGCVHVPIDPAAPPARRAAILRSADCRVELSSGGAQAGREADEAEAVRTVSLREAAASTLPPLCDPAGPDDDAYIIHTSGSTGVPKGAILGHAGFLGMIRDRARAFGLSPADRLLQFASLAFDASLWEIFLAWCSGAALAPVTRREIDDPDAFLAFAKDGGVTFATLPPTYLRELAGRVWSSLRVLVTAGEAAAPAQAALWAKELAGQNGKYVNAYGPTEASVCATTYTLPRDGARAARTVPIGRPIANTAAWIVNASGQPQPIGVAGEIWLAGPPLARGYLGDAALTERAFVPTPVQLAQAAERAGLAAARAYRTGDVALWNARGEIEFIGRADWQVKIRGHRVELGEIEERLLQAAGVTQACVVAKRDGAGGGGERLVAYVAAGSDFDEAACRAGLARTLPGYMLPSRIVRLPALPLSVSGKIDRAALPEPPEGEAAEAAGATNPPEGEREAAAAAAWSRALGCAVNDRLGDFFRLGGDSIRAIQAVSRLKGEGWKANVADIFSKPTLAAFAATLEREADANAGAARAQAQAREKTAAEGGRTELLPMQAWYLRTRAESDPGMAQDVWLGCAAGTPPTAIDDAWRTVWRRQPGLRTRFTRGTGSAPAQAAIMAAEEMACPVETINAATEEDAVRAAVAARESLSPWGERLIRVLRFPAAGGDRLYIAAHHLIVDGVSWRILLTEFDECLRRAAAGLAQAAMLPATFPREFAGAVHDWLTGPDAAAEDAYWRGRDESGGTSGEAPTTSSAPWLRRTLRLTPEETASLLAEPARVFGANAGTAILAAAARACRRVTGRKTLRAMVEGHGREGWALELGRTAGWCTAMFPILLPADALDAGSAAALRRVNDEWGLAPRAGAGYAALRWLAPEFSERNKQVGPDKQNKQDKPDRPPSRPDMRVNYLGHIGREEAGEVLSLIPAPAGFAPAGLGPESGAPDRPGLDVAARAGEGVITIDAAADADVWSEERLSLWQSAFAEEIRSLIAELKRTARPAATLSSHPWKGVAAEDWPRLLAETGCGESDIEAVHPLSPMQEGMLFHAQLEKGGLAYHEQFVYRIKGDFEPERFRAAWEGFVRRHGMLRARFAWSGLSRPMAVIVRDAAPEWNDEDWCRGADDDSGSGAEAREKRFAEWLESEKRREFPLARGPLTRLALFRFGPDEWRFVWSHHHILMDGGGMALARAETAALYRSAGDETAAGLPPAPAYRDFLVWLEKSDSGKMLAGWARKLAGYAALAGPAGRRPAPLAGGARAENCRTTLSREDTQRLRRRAAEWGVSVNHCVEAAWALLLARANRTGDVVFARVSSGRPADFAATERMVGLFINATPARVQVEADKPFASLAAAMRRDWGWAEARQYCSLGAIQAQSPLGRDLLDSAVVFEQFAGNGDGDEKALPFSMEPLAAFEQAGYPCWLAATPGEELALRLHYDAALFEPDAMSRNVRRVAAILTEAASDAAEALPAGKLRAMPTEEWDLISATFNATAREYPANETAPRLVAARMKIHPEKEACECSGRTLTYRQVEGLAARTAAALREAGVREGDRVGVGLERSERLPGVLLGIMSLGAAYVPLDPEFPESRLRHMAEDAGLAAAFVEAGGGAFLPAGVRRLTNADIDRRQTAEWQPGPDLSGGDRAAYILYTSGSTGLPKGVKVGQRGLTNFLCSMAKEPGMAAGDVILAVSSLAFDISGLELLLPLTTGGKTVVAARNEALDGLLLARRLARGDITMMQATPATWQMLLEAGWSGTPGLRALCGGEGLPRELADKLLGATAELWNMYGPTETTIWSTLTRVTPGTEAIHIGRPIANTFVHILDAAGMPAGIGSPGELCIGGDGLAFGYHRREELTAERFFMWTPPDGTAPLRLYRTGDLAFWRGDGTLGFLGREDFQVKIRGHRIELGEIEQALLELPGVRRAVAVATADASASALAAYVVLEPGAAEPDWRSALSARLPEYMIPTFITVLPALPLTPNGKVDRKALPAPTARPRATADGEAPRTGVEADLACLWRDVLGTGDIRREDSFFSLGGHSLKMVRLAAAMRRKWGAAPEMADLFRAATLAEMAALLGEQAAADGGGREESADMTDEERQLLEGL